MRERLERETGLGIQHVERLEREWLGQPVRERLDRETGLGNQCGLEMLWLIGAHSIPDHSSFCAVCVNGREEWYREGMVMRMDEVHMKYALVHIATLSTGRCSRVIVNNPHDP